MTTTLCPTCTPDPRTVITGPDTAFLTTDVCDVCLSVTGCAEWVVTADDTDDADMLV